MILSTHGIVASQIQSYAFLLDTYTSAAAAYSLRKLRSAYTGSAIRVRRSSDNTEQDIGFSSSFGLDTTSLTSFCSGTNGFVTKWYDQSGNGRNATQTTASNQPKIVNAGSVLVDVYGKPRIQGYQVTTTSLIAAYSSNQPVTSFGVVEYTSFTTPTTFPYALEMGDVGYTNVIGIGYSTKPRIYAGTALLSSISISQNTTYLSYALINGANSTIGINTTLDNGNIGSANPTIIKLFNAQSDTAPLNGYLSEIVIYGNNNSSNRAGISNNINSYYGIY